MLFASLPGGAISSQTSALGAITLDFETGDLRGWTATGTAFNGQPTHGDARQRERVNAEGEFWVSTGGRGNRPQGTLTSIPFTVPGGTLSFLIGGGKAFETRVEFHLLDPIEGSIRVRFASGNGTERMQRLTWDVSPWAGQRGEILIVDAASGDGGQIIVDDFRFSALSERPRVRPTRPDFRLPPVALPETEVEPPPELVIIPDVVERDGRAAVEILGAASLEGRVIDERESGQPPGTVIEQKPAAGSRVAPRTVVDLVVAIPRTTTVPELVGERETPALRLLEAADLRVGDTTREESRAAPGIVLRQSVRPGSRVVLGSTVDLVMSAPVRVEMPDLSGRSDPQARAMIERLELVVGAVTSVESRRAPDIVLTQSVRPGSRVVIGTAVDLMVSVPVTVRVPSLTGRSRAEAGGLLAGLELVAGSVSESESRQPLGTVLSQRPAAGSVVAINTAVDFVVAVPTTVLVPELVGQTEAEARRRLSAVELGVGAAALRESRQPAGTVLGQSVDAGARVVIDTAIDLVIAEPVRVTVPEVVGRSEAEATAVMESVELVVGEIQHQESAAAPGTVLTQSVNPGTQVQIGTSVNLLVAVVETVPVPSVVGTLIEEARRALVTGRLAVGGEELRETRSAEEGTVLEQSRAAGSVAAVGTAVNLVVATPEIVEVPLVLELTREEAIRMITGAGLVVGVVGESLSLQAGGTVLQQAQAAGSQVVFGTAVALQVARNRVIWAAPAGLLLLAIATTVVARLRRTRRRPSAPEPRQPAEETPPLPELRVKPVSDHGRQQVDDGVGPDAGLEIRLRPYIDPGKQTIESPDDLIAGERSEDE